MRAGPTLLALSLLALAGDPAVAAEPLPFRVERTVVHRELTKAYCWFHPRAAAVPGLGRGGGPAVFLTLQKHLAASDHYSGMCVMRSDDLGRTWTPPDPRPELDWRPLANGETISVCDATPGWHAPTGKLLVVGVQLRYARDGGQLLDRPRSHECAYAVLDPRTGRWQPWRSLVVPASDSKFFLLTPGCVQWLVQPDGTLLIPTYFRGPTPQSRYSATVLHCTFDGSTLTYRRHGDEMTLPTGRGLYEPSLARFGDKYYLTIRSDDRAYVAVGDDGLHFKPPVPWAFDDGRELGSYNTQQHWLTHSDGLFLAYTRRGANNDHVLRHRAPLFLAQVDPGPVRVMRQTEQVVIPERGVPLGNFGAGAVSPNESWVTDAEYILSDKPHARGADGSVFAARVLWSRPNRLVAAAGKVRVVTLGDSITKGVRPGVAAPETFAALLQEALRQDGLDAEVINVGIGGERTDQALARLERGVLSLKPDLVTVMYGTNDSYVDVGKAEPRLTAADYRRNLEELVGRLRRAGVKPVLMTEPRWGDKAKPNGAGEHPNLRLENYMEACREVAREKQVPLVDHYRAWSDRRAKGQDLGAWTTDECHPNPAGHKVLTEALLPVVKRALDAAGSGGK